MRRTMIAMGIMLGCGTLAQAQHIQSDYDHEANFGECKTYQWGKTGQEVKDPLMADRVIKAIDGQLVKKGLTKAAEGVAGACYVGYQAAVKETKGATINTMGGFGFGGRWGGGMGDIQGYTMKDGELVVDVFSSKKKLMWRGTATDSLSDKPEKVAEGINKAVEKMFEKFPPKAEK